MRVGQRTSSETYADFTLSRVPQGVRDSLSDEQYQAIRTALIGDDESARHRIDIRLRVSLFFRSYYVVLFAGRDRRGSTYRLEDARLTRIPVPVLRALHLLVSIVLSAVVLVLAFVAAYKIKNFLGIDVFPGFHLPDLLPFEQSPLTGAQGWA